ncbi:hypothetical protein BG005_001680 [Podila minutissima]|nr:hypothetical protein BG005_001680 [Podila minutissima]
MSGDIIGMLPMQSASTVLFSFSAGIRLDITTAEIAQTREVVEDEEKPINYRPVDRKHAVPESDEIIDEEIMDEVIIDDDLSSNDNEVLDANNDEDENNLKSMLKAEDRALKVAINTLKKARADIKKRLAQ